MKLFEKSNKLDYVCYDIRGPVMDEANRMIESGRDVLKLNIGNPATFGFEAPEPIVEEMKKRLVSSEGYSHSKGLLEARIAISEYCSKKHIPNVTPYDIYTGNGVSELITLTMNGLLNNGDEMLVPAPDYPLWTASVTLAGGNAVHYICDESSNWYPDIEDIRSKITDKTKGIVVINPNKPTGALYPKSLLEQIVEIAREYDLIIFADEIYDRLVFDGKEHISIASLAPDRPVNIEDYIAGINLLSSMRLCSNVPGQSIIPMAIDMLDSSDEMIVSGGRVYEQREAIYEAICDIPGLSAVKPDAAFYIFPKMDVKKFNIIDDERFALDLLKEKQILITHGGGFHWTNPDHFRIVYLPDVNMIEEAAVKMKDFFANYKQKV